MWDLADFPELGAETQPDKARTNTAKTGTEPERRSVDFKLRVFDCPTPPLNASAVTIVAWQFVPCKAVPFDQCVGSDYRSLNSLRNMAKLR